MKEGVLYDFVEKLNQYPGLEATLLPTAKGDTANALVKIMRQKQAFIFAIQIKNRIVPGTLITMPALPKNNQPTILLAKYITTPAKKLLQQQNINYADSVGNLYIAHEQLYIFNETNNTGRKNATAPTTELGKAGLQVVFQFLMHEDYINQPYRFIAEQASVTIDTVRRTIQYLLKQKLLLKKDTRTYIFTDRKKLLEEWVYAYNQKLLPKLGAKKYKNIHENTVQEADLLNQNINAKWTGVRAAEILNNNLIANENVLYADMPMAELMQALQIVPDKNGDIIVRECFWNTANQRNTTYQPIVHPILIYADLVNHEDPRAQEEAKIIYEKYVRDTL